MSEEITIVMLQKPILGISGKMNYFRILQSLIVKHR